MALQDGAVYRLKNAGSGTYLNAGNGTDPKSVSGWQKTEDAAQQWTAERTAQGDFRLKNANNQYLSVAGGPQSGAAIVVGRYRQEWVFKTTGSQYTITYPDTNFVLDLAQGSSNNGTRTILHPPNGGSNQLWIPEPLVTPPPPGENSPLQNNSIYLLRNAQGGTVASVRNATPHKSVQGWQKDGTPSQQWTAEFVGDGTEVRLKSADNQYLGVEGAPQNGAPVITGRYRQSWKFELHGSQYKFIYPDTTFVLELEHGTKNNGGKIQLWSPSSGQNQLWGSELASGGGSQDDGEAAKILKKNELYKIINVKSSTVFELSEDDKLVVGWRNIDQRDPQKWTLEDAGSGQFYIKNFNNSYLGVDGIVERGADIICSPKKQIWSIRVDNLQQKTFKVVYPNTSLAIDLDRGSAASGASIILWTVGNTPNQLWKFESTKPLNPFEFNVPYTIINTKSGTSADIKDDKITVVGNKTAKGRTSQQWTFETAPSKQAYIKHQSGKYLAVDGDPDYGAPIVLSAQKQAWDIKADAKDPTKFTINFPAQKYSVELDRGSATANTDVLLMSTWDTDSQKWSFTAVSASQDTKDPTQYYNDVFFPTSTSGWQSATPKTTALFYPVPITARTYKPPIVLSRNNKITISTKTLKELSGQDMWVPGDWRFATYGNQNGRVRFGDFNV